MTKNRLAMTTASVLVDFASILKVFKNRQKIDPLGNFSPDWSSSIMKFWSWNFTERWIHTLTFGKKSEFRKRIKQFGEFSIRARDLLFRSVQKFLATSPLVHPNYSPRQWKLLYELIDVFKNPQKSNFRRPWTRSFTEHNEVGKLKPYSIKDIAMRFRGKLVWFQTNKAILRTNQKDTQKQASRRDRARGQFVPARRITLQAEHDAEHIKQLYESLYSITDIAMRFREKISPVPNE